MVGLAPLAVVLSHPVFAIMHRHDVPAESFVIDSAAFPAIVDLLAPGDCLGTLIATEWLITANHCAQHLKADAQFNIGRQTLGMAAMYLHDDYDGDQHDIALVQLDDCVSGVEPMEWYTASDEAGQSVLFVGRGDSGTGQDGQRNAVSDGKTRMATNTVDSAPKGQLEFVFHSPSHTAVTSLEGISGDGDSGGPALLAVDQGWAVAGLSSYQDKNGNALGTYGVLEVYTRVSAHTDWIERGLNGQLDADDPKGCSASGMRQTNGAGWFLFLPLWIVWRKSQGRTHEPWVVNKTHFGYHDPCAF